MNAVYIIFLAVNFLYLSVEKGLTELVLSSININSKNATIVKCESKFTITNADADPIILLNTGSALEIYSPNINPRSEVLGSILGSCKYRYIRTRFTISKNISGNAGLTIDGKGSQILIDIFYYNTKYENYQEAVLKPDGIVVLRKLIIVESQPNPLFKPLQPLLEKIKKPGCSVKTTSSVAVDWINVTPFVKDYYLYRGLFCYAQGLTNYATVFVSPLRTASCISKEQFTAFQKLESFNGQPISGEILNFRQNLAKVNHIFGRVQYIAC